MTSIPLYQLYDVINDITHNLLDNDFNNLLDNDFNDIISALAVFGTLSCIFVCLVVYGAYASYSALFYIVGLMSSTLAVWAIVLLYVIDYTDSIIAYSMCRDSMPLFLLAAAAAIMPEAATSGPQYKYILFVTFLDRLCIKFLAL